MEKNTYKYHAFIAHSSDDLEIAVKFCKKLEKEFTIYFMHRDFKAIGHYIPVEIEKNLQRSRKVILLFSKKFLESDWCNFERVNTEKLTMNRKEVVSMPILLPGFSPDDIPKYLSRISYLRYEDCSCNNTDDRKIGSCCDVVTEFWEKVCGSLRGS